MLGRSRIFVFIVFITIICSCKGHIKQIPLADFFKTPEKTFFKISPDGKYIAYLKPYKDKQNLFVQSLTDGTEYMETSFEDYPVSGWYFWTYNNQLVFNQDIVANDGFKMYALDVATHQLRTILSLEKVKVSLINRNRQLPDIITIRMN